ncbi:IS110 family transposase, partial [Peptacetobacter sp. AB800]|uniref:IS110 family transposase n=1 Tax=Peptacetobacter sp. AB800 TaxID=3388428 RepID=UPI0039FD891A
MYYIGIDIAKNKHEVSIIDASGKLLSESISFSNTIKGFEKLIKYLSSYNVYSDNCIVGMEATGHYWLSIYSYLVECKFNTFVINPIQSEAFRKMYIRKTKTDSKDSFVIAQVMRFGEFSSSPLSDERLFELKNLTRYRFSLVDESSDWKRKLIALLDQVFPEYDKLFSDIFGVTSKNLLSKYPLPEDMLSISTETLAELLSKCSNGRFGFAKAEEIQNSALNTFGVKFAKRSFSFQIKQIIDQISFLEEQLKFLEKEIEYLLNDINPIITTITGIGSVLGASIIAEIGDISRFEK